MHQKEISRREYTKTDGTKGVHIQLSDGLSFDIGHGRYCEFEDPWVQDTELFMSKMEFTRGMKNAIRSGAVEIYFDKAYGYGHISTTLSIWRTDGYDFNHSMKAQAEVAEEWWEEFKEHCLGELRDDYEYRTSREQVIESIEANDMLFHVDGEGAGGLGTM